MKPNINQNHQQRPGQQKFVDHLRQHWLKYFLGVLAVLLVVSAIISAITPTPPEQQPVTVPPISSGVTDSPSSASVRFADEGIALPEALPVYRAAGTSLSANQLATTIAEQFNIPKDPSPYLDNVWTNYETKEQVSYEPHSGKVIYSSFADEAENNNQNQNEAANQPFNTAEAIGAAEDFLPQLASFPELTPQNKQIYYLQDERTAETSSEGDFIVIPFNFKLGDYPVYFAGARKSYAEIYVNKQNQVVKAEFFPPPPTPVEAGNKEIKSLDQAGDEITAGQATIIAAGSRTGQVNTDDITQLNINTTELEYRFSPENNTYLPYFRFTAEGLVDEQSQPFNLTLILPAIHTSNSNTTTNPTQN